jgi:hypothetical protein
MTELDSECRLDEAIKKGTPSGRVIRAVAIPALILEGL